MNAQHAELYDRLQRFSLDQPASKLPFSQRLAQENSWSLDYAHRVIEEYKKFAFLAVVSGHSVSPSDPVDQVWHLHLTYTRSYWEQFCPQVLRHPLHHEPTEGGRTENHKFQDWYAQTLASYERLFGQRPPKDIWPQPADRARNKEKFVRVNAQQHWIVPKRPLQRSLAASLTLTLPLMLGGCYVTSSASLIDVLSWFLFALPFIGFVALVLQAFARRRRKPTPMPRSQYEPCTSCDSGDGFGAFGDGDSDSSWGTDSFSYGDSSGGCDSSCGSSCGSIDVCR